MVRRAEAGLQGLVARPVADLKGAPEVVMARCSNRQRGRISEILLQPSQVSSADRCQPADAIKSIGGNYNSSLRLPQNKVVKHHPAPA